MDIDDQRKEGISTPYFSDDLIEEVRSRNDIVDVIGGYVRLQKKGSTYFGLCPFHNEKTGSFSVSPNKQMYYCFGCGAGGNVFTFLMQYENYTFTEAMQVLADRSCWRLTKKPQSIFINFCAAREGKKHMRISVSGSCRMKRCANLAWAIRISTATISIAI